MLNLGVPELVLIAGFASIVLIVVIVAVILAVRAGSAGRSGAREPARLAYAVPRPPLPVDLQERARALCYEGKTIHAIKLIREETGLGLKEAKDVADALRAGVVLPGGSVDTSPVDLASRVRELKATGRAEQAVFLVRGETGMDQAAAEAFVATL